MQTRLCSGSQTLPTSCRPNMRQAFSMNNDAAIEPQGQPRAHDTDHVRDLQCAGDVGGYSSCSVLVRIRLHHRHRHGFRGWRVSHHANLRGLRFAPCNLAFGPGRTRSHRVHHENQSPDITTDGACPADRPIDQQKNKKWKPTCAWTATSAMHPFKKVADWIQCHDATVNAFGS